MADRWVLDYGPGSDEKRYATPQKAIDAAVKELTKSRTRAEKFARDTLPDIRHGIETLEETPAEGRTLRVCVDRYYETYMTINIRREEIPADELAKIEAAKAARRKDKAPR